MSPLDEGQEQEIIDVGNLNDLKDGDLVCWLANQELAREVYDFFEWANEKLSGESSTANEKAMKEKFERVYSFIHKRVRYSYEFEDE